MRRSLSKKKAARGRVFSSAQGLVRTIARRSIKKRKYRGAKTQKSAPGNPPFSHTDGSFGIRTILFHYDDKSGSVIIGPVGRSSAHSVPEALEFGGPAIVRIPRYMRKARGGAKTQRVVIKRRPFMAPALEKFESDYPALWKDAIK